MTEICCHVTDCKFNEDHWCSLRAIVLTSTPYEGLTCHGYVYMARWEREKEQENADCE